MSAKTPGTKRRRFQADRRAQFKKFKADSGGAAAPPLERFTDVTLNEKDREDLAYLLAHNASDSKSDLVQTLVSGRLPIVLPRKSRVSNIAHRVLCGWDARHMSLDVLEFAYRMLDCLGIDLKAELVDGLACPSSTGQISAAILGTAAVHLEWAASSSVSRVGVSIPLTRMLLGSLHCQGNYWHGVEQRVARIVASTPTSIRHTGVPYYRPDELDSIIDVLADKVLPLDDVSGFSRQQWASLVLSLAQPYDDWPLEFRQGSLGKLGRHAEMLEQANAYKDRVAAYMRDGRILLANLAFEGIADLAALVVAFVVPRFLD